MKGNCGARNRSGAPCKRSPVAGKRRCHLHGGAPGSGAPTGEQNGNYRHGRFTRAAAEERKVQLMAAIQRRKESEARVRARLGEPRRDGGLH